MAQSKITYKIDLKEFTDKPDKELANEVGEFLLDKILEYASKAKSINISSTLLRFVMYFISFCYLLIKWINRHIDIVIIPFNISP